MEIIKHTPEKLVFSVNVNETLANSIRRSVNQVSTVAIDEVEISKNDTALYDETVAHRIGLIPIRYDKSLKEGEEKVLKLKVKKEGIVYSGDFKGDAKIVYDKIPITILNQNKVVEIKAFVRPGKGIDHAKFSPGFITYRNSCEISLDKEFSEDLKRVFPDLDLKTKGEKIIVQDNREKPLIDFCEGISIKSGKKAEVKDNENLIISVESFGQMDAKDIFKKSLEILKKNLDQTAKKI